MSPTLLDYLRYILDEADYIASQVKSLNKMDFRGVQPSDPNPVA